MKRLLLVGLVAAALCAACTNPRVIKQMTYRDSDKTFKAITVQEQFCGLPLYAVVKCSMAEDGALSQCRQMAVNFDYE
ncbi:MAG TPA: hypothetical protein PKH10_09595 [bacterium]|nr:hypothetical protein [bacterium]